MKSPSPPSPSVEGIAYGSHLGSFLRTVCHLRNLRLHFLIEQIMSQKLCYQLLLGNGRSTHINDWLILCISFSGNQLVPTSLYIKHSLLCNKEDLISTSSGLHSVYVCGSSVSLCLCGFPFSPSSPRYPFDCPAGRGRHQPSISGVEMLRVRTSVGLSIAIQLFQYLPKDMLLYEYQKY